MVLLDILYVHFRKLNFEAWGSDQRSELVDKINFQKDPILSIRSIY